MKKHGFFKFVLNHLRTYWVLWVGLLGVGSLIYKVSSPVADRFHEWILDHAKIDHGIVAIDGWPSAILAAFCFAVLTLLGLSAFTIVMVFRQNRKGGPDAAKTEVLMKTFHRTIEASYLIGKKLFPMPALPIKQVRSCTQVFTFYDDGDCHHLEELVLCAKDRDIHFIERMIDADPQGDPAAFPDEIELKVESGTDEKLLRYLINKNEMRSKSILIFFLPLVRSGGKDERMVKTTFFWPGLMRGLVESGTEDFENQVKSVDPVPLIEYQFWVKPRLGRLICSNLGPELGTDAKEILEKATDRTGMQGWIYKGYESAGRSHHAPPAGTSEELSFLSVTESDLHSHSPDTLTIGRHRTSCQRQLGLYYQGFGGTTLAHHAFLTVWKLTLTASQ